MSSPEWIEAARAVCFGSPPGGLPEGYGWITLLMSPLLMLTALVAIWTKELTDDLHLLFSSKTGRVLAVGLVILPFAAINWGVAKVLNQEMAAKEILSADLTTEEFPEAYPHFEGQAANFSLLNQRGEEIRIESLAGRKFLLTFAFSHCSSTCPGLVNTALEAANSFDGERPAVVLVTLDPWRDTPSALPGIAERWKLHEIDHALSGDIETVEAVAKAYQVSSSRDLQSGDIEHTGVTFLFNEKGELIYQLNSPSVKWIKQALERM